MNRKLFFLRLASAHLGRREEYATVVGAKLYPTGAKEIDQGFDDHSRREVGAFRDLGHCSAIFGQLDENHMFEQAPTPSERNGVADGRLEHREIDDAHWGASTRASLPSFFDASRTSIIRPR